MNKKKITTCSNVKCQQKSKTIISLFHLINPYFHIWLLIKIVYPAECDQRNWHETGHNERNSVWTEHNRKNGISLMRGIFEIWFPIAMPLESRSQERKDEDRNLLHWTKMSWILFLTTKGRRKSANVYQKIINDIKSMKTSKLWQFIAFKISNETEMWRYRFLHFNLKP